MMIGWRLLFPGGVAVFSFVFTLPPHIVKAIGGYRVKNTCWVQIKELFNTSSALFTECKNSIPSSRYLRLSTAGYDGNRPFPYYFPIQKMG